jgi:arsenite methyltransferase
MREVARRRCADLIGQGRVRLEPRDAAGTGEPDASGDVVLAVNDVIWPGRSAGFAELQRVLRPRRPHAADRAPEMLRIEVAALATEIVEAGFTGIETWTWEPPGRAASTAVQLRAQRPAP